MFFKFGIKFEAHINENYVCEEQLFNRNKTGINVFVYFP